MQKDNKFFEDMARLASGAAGGFLEMKREMESMIALQMEKLLKNMQLATKEEIDASLAMMGKLRSEQEEIKTRLDRIEAEMNALKKAAE